MCMGAVQHGKMTVVGAGAIRLRCPFSFDLVVRLHRRCRQSVAEIQRITAFLIGSPVQVALYRRS